MGNYSVPKEIRALKPKGTIVKKIKSNYYVYSHSQHKDENGKWKTDPGKLLGKIVPSVGYCPNSERMKDNKIECYDYGTYFLICCLAKDDYSILLDVFNPDEAMLIFSLAAIFEIEGFCGLKASEEYFSRSLFARDFPDLSFSYKRISSLLESIGRIPSLQSKFQTLANTDSNKIAIDGHTISTYGSDNTLSTAGYKSHLTGSDYMNLMMAIDSDSGLTIAAKMFPGYLLDKTSFKDFFIGLGDIKDKYILIDMGFSDKDNLKLIEDNGGYFIMPISENYKEYKEVLLNKETNKKEFIYTSGNKSDLIEYKELEGKTRRAIYYKNISEAERLKKAYLHGIDQGKKGYTQEGYDEQIDSFGVIVLTTNKKDISEKEVYEIYKKRWSIEIFYNRLKNGLNFSGLNLDDYAVVQGLAFIMLIVGRIDARLLQVTKKLGYTRNSLLLLMSHLHLVESTDGTRISNIKKEHLEVLNKLGIEMNICNKCLPIKQTISNPDISDQG